MPQSLTIEWISTAEIEADPRNARTHSKQQIRQIAASIEEFGFINPVLIDESNRVIAGHGRLGAAERLNLERVPAIRLRQLTEAQKRALALADNKLAENAGWDWPLLAAELRYLTEVEVDFDVTVTGFATAEIDLLIESLDEDPGDSEADRLPDDVAAESVTTQPGDLWILDRHRLLCGDATSPADLERLMQGARAQMVFTDPPYNVRIDGNVCGLGRIRHREFAMASGEMTEAEFTAFLRRALSNLAAHSIDGSIHYVFMDWRHMRELLTAGRVVYSELKNLCVWNKTNAGMGTFYRSKHELIFVFKNGSAPHINNFELGQHGRHRTNVWDHAGINTLGAGRLDALDMHPTVKPVALVADAILDCSRRGGIVLDGFAGSGTTLIAAEKTGRGAYVMELDPKYVETALRRWEAYTGGAAVHSQSGLGLELLRERRGTETAMRRTTASRHPEVRDAR